MLSEQEVLNQSRSAFRQWGETWDKHARINGEIHKEQGTSHRDLLYSGAGKTALCIANGPSFEDKIGMIKKYEDNIDIICVDKCFGKLLENGIKPKYVFLADAGISYEKYCKPYDTSGICLITNVTANVEWTQNWEGKIYFYVNKDNIKTEERYSAISGCYDSIPASSNVGNSVVVFSTQIMGYDKYILLGYDYCWGPEDKYYAFEDNDKRYWMSHINMIDKIGRLVYTSNNLVFSARWMGDFVNNVLRPRGIKIVDCSGKGILSMQTGDLEKHLGDAEIRKLNDLDKQRIVKSRMEQEIIRSDTPDKSKLLNDALKNLTVTDIIINYIPDEVVEWVS